MLVTSFIYYVLPIFLFIRVLFGTVFGVLVFSLVLYLLTSYIGDSKPLTFDQLLLWLDSLPIDSKTSVINSILVILGFLVAFHSAASNWKAELKAHLFNRIADEINVFNSEASNLLTKSEIYIHSLVDTANFIIENGASPQSIFKVQHVLNNAQKFYVLRDRLFEMSIEAFGIVGRNNLALSNIKGAIESLDNYSKYLGELTQLLWVDVPLIPHDSPDFTNEFVTQLDLLQCSKYIAAYNKNFGYINSLAGSVCGSLMGSFVEFNFSSYFFTFKNRSSFTDHVKAMFERKTKEL